MTLENVLLCFFFARTTIDSPGIVVFCIISVWSSLREASNQSHSNHPVFNPSGPQILSHFPHRLPVLFFLFSPASFHLIFLRSRCHFLLPKLNFYFTQHKQFIPRNCLKQTPIKECLQLAAEIITSRQFLSSPSSRVQDIRCRNGLRRQSKTLHSMRELGTRSKRMKNPCHIY